MDKTKRFIFTNNPELRPQNSHEDSPQKPEPYVVSEPLKKAVNLASQTSITIRPLAKLILCYGGGLRFWYS